MKIAPMEIPKQQFARRFRGFDRDEVRAYLHLVAEDVAEIFDALRGSGRVQLYFERNGTLYVREFYWRS